MTTPDAAPDVQAIQARLDAATKGPWRAVIDDSGDILVVMPDKNHHTLYFGSMEGSCKTCHANQEFVAHSRTDIPALLIALAVATATVARLQGELADVRSLLAELDDLRDSVWDEDSIAGVVRRYWDAHPWDAARLAALAASHDR